MQDEPKQSDSEGKLIGFRIVVMDRGWVHAGTVFDCGETVRIENAKCIRRWGTTRGLGELVNGPLQGTVLDSVGTIEARKSAVIFTIVCNREF